MVLHGLRRLYYYDAIAGLLVMVGHYFVGPPFKILAFALYLVIHLVLLGKAMHRIELADREATIARTIQTLQSQLNQDAGSQHQAHD